MDKGKKPSAKLGHTLRRYWWLFAITATVIVVAVLKHATADKDVASETAAPSSTPLDGTLADQEKSDVKIPVAPRLDVASGDLELPIPQDTEAIARYYSTDGLPNIADVAVIWEKKAQRYIDFLHKETFAQGLSRTYMGSELAFVLGNYPNSQSTNPDIIRIFARTRRFAKLVSYIRNAKENRDITSEVETIALQVQRFIDNRRFTEAQVRKLIKDKPEIFAPGAPENLRRPMIDLCRGFGLTGLDVPEGIIPMSLEGTQLGIVANSFLLGMTEHPSAIQPLLDILSYDDAPIIKELARAWNRNATYVKWDYSFANRPVVADAIDRILIANVDSDTLPADAKHIAEEYQQWRAKQDFPKREIVPLYSYDEPRTPYHLPGTVTGVSDNIQPSSLELPLSFSVSDVDVFEFNEQALADIIQYANRFNSALPSNSGL
jgi:hypothetical protein